MKKIFSLFVVAGFLFVAGCGDDTAKKTDTTKKDTGKTTETKKEEPKTEKK